MNHYSYHARSEPKAEYERISLYVPHGMRDMIKAAAEKENISVNGYLFELFLRDTMKDYHGALQTKKKGLTPDDVELLRSWRIANRYIDMIESYEVIDKNAWQEYRFTLKEGYINDHSQSRYIICENIREIRRVVKMSHRE